MICRSCKRVLTDSLVCVACIERASQREFFLRQKIFLPRFVAGELPLRTGRTGNDHYYHLQLLGEPTHTWCGEKMADGKRQNVWWKTLERTADLCPRCDSAIREMAAGIEKEKTDAVSAHASESPTV